MPPSSPADTEHLDAGKSITDVRLKGRLQIAVIAWLLFVAVGLGCLLIYANQPGQRGEPVVNWPEGMEVGLSKSKSTLLLFAHPRCPCTRATLDELAWIMTRCGSNVECQVHFVQPAGKSGQWMQSDIWETASSIPGVTVWADREGQLTKQFGAKTSGHAMLYDSYGRLRFEGGITPSRGHRGSNSGRQEIIRIANTRQPKALIAHVNQPGNTDDVATESTCVFGCPLFAARQVSATEDLHAFQDR